MTRFVCLLIVMLVAGVGCASIRRPDHALAPESLSLQFKFAADSIERRDLTRGVGVLGQRLRASGLAASIDRLEDGSRRYFVFVVPPQATRGGHVLFAMVTLTSDAPEVSEVFDTGVPFGPIGVGIQRIARIDSDALFDVVFCDRDPEERRVGRTRVLGYRGKGWYPVSEIPQRDRIECESG